MTTQQENKLSMYLAVKAVCARHQTVWQSLPAFADAVTRFESHLDAIKTLTPSQGRCKTGLADDKKRLRLEMTRPPIPSPPPRWPTPTPRSSANWPDGWTIP